jgi:DNA-directed RNA polymerase specialized sigma24 family protein
MLVRDPPDPAADPAAGLRADELEAALGRELAGAAPAVRDFWQRRHAAGQSFKEIAEATSAPLGTVASTLHRFRQGLRKSLAGLT